MKPWWIDSQDKLIRFEPKADSEEYPSWSSVIWLLTLAALALFVAAIYKRVEGVL